MPTNFDRRQLRRQHLRAGFSLVEVLISIGVVAIGLLGVMALLPLGHHQAFVGSLEDRKAVAGRMAYKIAHIYEIDKPFRWVTPAGVRVIDNATLMNVLTTPSLPRVSFCIDPLLLAENNTFTTFPYDAARGSGPQMARITVALGGNPLGKAHADELCRSLDDVIFEQPADPLLPPQQIDIGSTAATTLRWDGATSGLMKRQNTGRMSWMLTMSPELGEEVDLYNASAVVFYNRSISAFAREEFAFDVSLDSLGAGGGEITLKTRTGGSIDHRLEDMDLRPGAWLMLGAAVQVRAPWSQAGNNITHSFFRWYRVVNAGGPTIDNGNGTFQREFTIVGPDWDKNMRGAPQVAIVCPTVVAVFEKTMRLQTSSLWMPQ